MAIAFNVQATVIDLRTDMPRVSDTFWVDTNVWFWMTYPSATFDMEAWRQQQTKPYTRFMQECFKQGSTICWSPLQLSELGHQIEKMEYEIAKRAGTIPPDTRPKEYRHKFTGERQRVAKVIQTAWQDVCGNGSQCLQPPLVLDQAAATQASADSALFPLDGHDLYFLQSVRVAGNPHILTDDGDFCTVSGITLFTANRNVIEAARVQGKLIAR